MIANENRIAAASGLIVFSTRTVLLIRFGFVYEWTVKVAKRHVGRRREVLKTLLDGHRLSFVPDDQQYRFTGALSTDRLLDGAVNALMASPRGHVESCTVEATGRIKAA